MAGRTLVEKARPSLPALGVLPLRWGLPPGCPVPGYSLFVLISARDGHFMVWDSHRSVYGTFSGKRTCSVALNVTFL